MIDFSLKLVYLNGYEKSIFSLTLVLLIVVSVLGGDLVFRAEKEIKTANYTPVTIGEFDTLKNKTLRGGALNLQETRKAVLIAAAR